MALKEKLQQSVFKTGADAGKPGELTGTDAGAIRSVLQGIYSVNPDSVSKVVDPQTGEPMVVYHGTGADFSVFDGERVDQNYGVGDEQGFFFTSKPAEAAWAADHAAEVVDGSASVMPVFLDIKDPVRVDVDSSSERRGLGDPTSYLDAHKDRIMGWVDGDGRDGVVVINPARGYGTYVALNPTQIKSATGNNGNFDPQDPDIRHFGVDDFASNIGAWQAPEESKFDTLAYKLQDKQIDTKRVIEAIKAKGKQVAEALA